jgi:hypothetical protein
MMATPDTLSTATPDTLSTATAITPAITPTTPSPTSQQIELSNHIRRYAVDLIIENLVIIFEKCGRNLVDEMMRDLIFGTLQGFFNDLAYAINHECGDDGKFTNLFSAYFLPPTAQTPKYHPLCLLTIIVLQTVGLVHAMEISGRIKSSYTKEEFETMKFESPVATGESLREYLSGLAEEISNPAELQGCSGEGCEIPILDRTDEVYSFITH